MINILYSFKVPDPVAFFPLNAAYGTKEINNRAVKGIPRGVTLAPGPDGRPNYSYKFSGSSNSYIEIPNSIGGPLDVRYSMTMLCWFTMMAKTDRCSATRKVQLGVFIYGLFTAGNFLSVS